MTSVVSSSRRVVAHSHARSCRAAASRSSSFSHLFRDHAAPREANVRVMGSSEEDARRLTVVRKMLRDFEKRWKFTQRGCGAGCAAWLRRAVCGCMCGGETDEERLERIVRAKVRRDVKIAFAWDGELSELGLEAKERYMMELARFEHLTYAEQKIYMQNGGMALEVHGS